MTRRTNVSMVLGIGLTVACGIAPQAWSAAQAQQTGQAQPVAPPQRAPGVVQPSLMFGFETDAQGWTIPDWAMEKPDEYFGQDVTVGNEGATEGNKALAISVVFPGGRWGGAIVQAEDYWDWSPHNYVAADITLPPDAPAGLRGKLILTVGEGWEWIEMSRSVQLKPGGTTTITADVAPGSGDWKKKNIDEEFRRDVRKMSVRVETNKAPYQGKIYIDNVRLE